MPFTQGLSWRAPRLELPSDRIDRPRRIVVAAVGLFVVATINTANLAFSVVALFGQGFASSTTVLLLILLTLITVVVGLVPLLVGLAALRGSTAAAGWAIFYVVAQALIALQSLAPWQCALVAVAVVALTLLWTPTARRYARQRSSTGI